MPFSKGSLHLLSTPALLPRSEAAEEALQALAAGVCCTGAAPGAADAALAALGANVTAVKWAPRAERGVLVATADRTLRGLAEAGFLEVLDFGR